MAWRIVVQPNGMLARFSDISDDFTEYDMTEGEAIELCTSRGMQLAAAKRKVTRAFQNPERFDQEIEAIRFTHGEKEAELRNAELRITAKDRQEREAREARERAEKMRELAKAMREPDTFAIRMIYTGEDGRRFMRTVSPIRFEGRDRMQAYCLSQEGPRVFILDRIEKIIAVIPADSVLMPCEMIEVEG